ncbi:DedA family protein [hydrothermal vent metagenome]|uniref:DedA family protein n=1 Tax=hydrothermal vent metagenome TaxID=652676 RepID=A0A1W1CM17_9ZZZZ
MNFYHFLYEHFSYTVLFIWSLFEGEIGLALAGMLSKEKVLLFEYVVAIAIIGALLGDITIFFIGYLFRCKSKKLLTTYENKVQNIEKWLKKYGSWVIIFERFIYGTHIPVLLMLATSKYNFLKFFLLDIIGVTLWALIFTTFGFYFGEKAINILFFIQHHLSVVIILAFFFFLIYKLKN